MERTVALASSTKAFDAKKLPKTLRLAIDSMPLEGAGRVEDTLNLLAHAARKVVSAAAAVLERKAADVARAAGAPMLAESSIKKNPRSRVERSRAEAGAVMTLVEQLDALEAWVGAHMPEEASRPPLSDLLATLGQIRDQDLEPDPSGGGSRIRQGVAPERRVSVEDGEVRHGRKSKLKGPRLVSSARAGAGPPSREILQNRASGGKPRAHGAVGRTMRPSPTALGARHARGLGLVVGALLVACGSDVRPDAPPAAPPGTQTNANAAGAGAGGGDRNDAGSSGATDGGAGTTADGGAGTTADGGADAGPRDPTTCAVGPADGCCPTALALGGSDPDCASLACAAFTKDAPIPLHPPLDQWLGQVAGAWNGAELVLAWTQETPGSAPIVSAPTDVTLQRRSSTGVQLGANAVLRADALPPANASTELALDPSGDVLFAWQRRQDRRYVLARLPLAGPPAWTAPLGVGCNDFGGALRIVPDSGRLFVGMAQYTCGGSTYQPLLFALDPSSGAAAGPQGFLDLRDGARPDLVAGSAFVYRPDAHQLDAIYGRDFEGDVHVRRLDLAASTATPTPGVLIYPGNGLGHYAPSAAFDGTHLGVASLDREFTQSTSAYVFRLFDVGAAATGPSIATTALATFADSAAFVRPPSVLWTGDGYIVAIPYILRGAGTNPERLAYRTRLVSLAPQGQVRETFELDALPSMQAKVLWAGGRVAITWVRPSGPTGNTSQSFLRWLSCAP